AVYCREAGIPVLAEIPDDRRVAEAYSRGELMVDALPEYRPLFERLYVDIARLRDVAASARRLK
ncbi:MAG: (4Fe-4S)-binding protein, partial [Kiritimatiellia bacterium]